MSAPVIITDNGIMAKRQYPGARVVVAAEDIWALPKGARVRVAQYAVGAVRHNPVTVALTMAACGAVDLETVEEPLG